MNAHTPAYIVPVKCIRVNCVGLIHDVSHTIPFASITNVLCFPFDSTYYLKMNGCKRKENSSRIESKGWTQTIEIEKKILCWPFDSNAFNISISSSASSFFPSLYSQPCERFALGFPAFKELRIFTFLKLKRMFNISLRFDSANPAAENTKLIPTIKGRERENFFLFCSWP